MLETFLNINGVQKINKENQKKIQGGGDRCISTGSITHTDSFATIVTTKYNCTSSNGSTYVSTVHTYTFH